MLGVTFTRMKCLVSPMIFSPIPSSPTKLTKKTSALFSLASNLTRKSAAQNPSLAKSSSKASVFSVQNRGVQTGSSSSSSSSVGEIHVIVGPMFAGKTTSLLRRVQTEQLNGSLQVRCSESKKDLDKTLKSLCFSGRLNEAVALLCRRVLPVDSRIYSLLLQESIFRKEYMMGRRIHAQMVVGGCQPNEYLKTKLLILYEKSGDLGTACVLFDRLLVKSVISWNAMIAGYVQNGLEDVGLDFYYEMRHSGLTPDQYTFASVFRACATLATLEHGKRAHAILTKTKIKENVVVTSALVDMYFKCSNLLDGQKVFDKCANRNVVTWTALICGYGQHGKVMEVLNMFHKMINDGFRPNYVTFLAVLCACSHGGLIDEGWKYFYSMTRDYGIFPRKEHYAAMVDLLGRSGRVQEAYDFVLQSPCKDRSVLWGSLLEACKKYGNIDFVKLATERYLELEPDNAEKYVVLSNAYASFGLWKNVAEVRGVMRRSGLIKEPAYSRIELQGEVHYFFKRDKSHYQSGDECQMIKDLTCMLQDAGYIPDFLD